VDPGVQRPRNPVQKHLEPGPDRHPHHGLQADSPEDADAIRALFAAAIPLNRWGAGEIASAALFLASDDSSFVARRELSVDGGSLQV